MNVFHHWRLLLLLVKVTFSHGDDCYCWMQILYYYYFGDYCDDFDVVVDWSVSFS